ncbi:serine/threonine-protein kinase [Polyangium sp. y55x31]|uniref:serine/threonine-protein kinase n=1 Tax=Polyangium sp. y55x31 TaxID=3042688 RepID=UPI0024831418|nr:serine/threonine-protein kinase [Polyangium sp. y55x31]MDI1483523.1 serine/threonine-protein kinase [Polyangium sp. y55x31]
MTTERPDPRRVEAIFDAVVDLGPEEAQFRLDAACEGDRALRAAVDRLLEHDRRADRDFLAPRPALLSAALRELPMQADGAERPSAAFPDAPPVAARIGRFAVVRKLGEGTMGVVYMGYDEMLDRRVAIKLLRPSVAGVGWLLREGQALGRLAHPNVVAIHEAGEHEGRVYLAMEFVEGPTLRAHLAERPRPFPEVLSLFLCAARGLAAVHDAGLVHRDFKPENVLVGKDGRPRIVDFGMAALARRDAGTNGEAGRDAAPPSRRPGALDVSILPRGAIAGTPAFMAPEQLRGERATAASDQWSFCAALYHAAYGVPPYSLDGDFVALSRRVLAAAPEIPAQRGRAPAWLGPILLSGLAKDPAARFPSMHALLAAIEAHLPRDPESDRRVIRRELVTLRVALLGVVVVTSGLAFRRLFRAEVTLELVILVNCAALLLVLTVIVVRWRRLSQNRMGRRAAGIVAGVEAVMLVHRLIGIRLGTPLDHVLVNDLVLLATVLGTLAWTDRRRIALPAAIAMAGALLGLFLPSAATLIHLAAGTLVLLLLIADVMRER